MITGTSKNCSIVRKWINVRSVVYAEQQDCRKFSGFRLIKHELVQTLLQAFLWTFQYFNFFWASSLLSIDRFWRVDNQPVEHLFFLCWVLREFCCESRFVVHVFCLFRFPRFGSCANSRNWLKKGHVILRCIRDHLYFEKCSSNWQLFTLLSQPNVCIFYTDWEIKLLRLLKDCIKLAKLLFIYHFGGVPFSQTFFGSGQSR